MWPASVPLMCVICHALLAVHFGLAILVLVAWVGFAKRAQRFLHPFCHRWHDISCGLHPWRWRPLCVLTATPDTLWTYMLSCPLPLVGVAEKAPH